MIQRDFILRLIEQLGALLRAFTSSQGRIAHPTEMFVALNEACRQGLGLSFETLSAMSPQEILNLFESGGATFQSRTALAACLFGHKAKIVSKMPEATRAIPAAQMALYLWQQLRGDPALPPEYEVEEHIEELVKFLCGCSIEDRASKRGPLCLRRVVSWN